MNASEWAGWVVIGAFLVFLVAVALAAAWVGGMITHALGSLGL